MSVKFLSAILGPEMGASILWTPGKNAFFLQEKPMSIKFLVLGGGGVFWVLGFGGGGCADFIYGRVGFSQKTREGCGCFRGLFGGAPGKLQESPGKIAGKIFPNREML